MDCRLAQRGRALIDFEVGLRQEANRMLGRLKGTLADRGVTAETLPDDVEARHEVIDRTLADVPEHQTRLLISEWSWKAHGLAAEEAFDEVRETVVPALDALAQGGTTITAPAGYVPPKYFSEIWFHRTAGGWDASPYNGFIHGELVHKRYVCKIFPGDPYKDRRAVLKELGASSPKRILELGTSSGHYTKALADQFPEAEITGLDPSVRMLEQARRVGNARGAKWKLYVLSGENTGFADGSFDLVTSYAIHHEIPPKAVTQWFAEAYRLLAPGGELLMMDVPRYAAIDKLAAWAFDWTAKWGGEPFWRATATMDFGAGARAAGFEAVRSGNPAGLPHLYYVYGRKPGLST